MHTISLIGCVHPVVACVIIAVLKSQSFKKCNAYLHRSTNFSDSNKLFLYPKLACAAGLSDRVCLSFFPSSFDVIVANIIN